MRQIAWISLLIVVLIAACGPPTVSDLDNNGNPVGDSDDDDGTTPGDDDDDGSSSPTPSGNPQPTLTNVPSFATWDSTIRGLGCATCHSGSAGGFTSNPGDALNKKSYWFSAICDRSSEPGEPGEGTFTYNPPVGRLRAFYCGQGIDLNDDGDMADVGETHSGDAIPNACATIDDWFAEATVAPPNCMDFYDLANSS